MFHQGGEKEDQKTGTGPVAVPGSNVTLILGRKLRDGRVIDCSPPRDRLTFIVGDDCMDTDAFHIGMKGMLVGRNVASSSQNVMRSPLRSGWHFSVSPTLNWM